MGVAKAGLESASRYLALHLGKQGIRSNLVVGRPAAHDGGQVDPGLRAVRGRLGRAGAARLGPHRPGAGRARRSARCCPTGSRPPPARSSTSTAATTRSASALERASVRRAGMGRRMVVRRAAPAVSFGGPERPDDVLPFLENVTRGRGVPPERLAEVAEHYQHFGGVSPINQQCRDLLAAIGPTSRRTASTCRCTGATATGTRCSPTPWRRCATTASRRALAFVTSAYGGYSSCRQYLEDIAAARAAVGAGAPGDRQAAALPRPPGLRRAARRRGARRAGHADPARRTTTRLVFTAHSIPVVDGRAQRARTAAATRPSCARPPRLVAAAARARPAVGPGLAEPLRPAAGAVAGAGRQRPPGGAGRRGRHRGGGQPDRVRLRPPGGGLGPRQRGRGDRAAARPALRPGGHARAPTRGSWRWCASWCRSGSTRRRRRGATPAGYARRSGTPARSDCCPPPARTRR